MVIRVVGNRALFVDIDRERGDVVVYEKWTDDGGVTITTIVAFRISAVQSANLRHVLERAEDVLSTGVGDMEPR